MKHKRKQARRVGTYILSFLYHVVIPQSTRTLTATRLWLRTPNLGTSGRDKSIALSSSYPSSPPLSSLATACVSPDRRVTSG